MRIDAGARAGDLTALARRLSTEALFVTAKIPTSETVFVHDLEDMGFRIVDTALTFRSDRLVKTPSSAVRFSNQGDRDRVVEIARSAFKYSRFHLDPGIPASLANRIKAEWAGNFFTGQRGDAMITIEADGQVAGFVLLLDGAGDDVIVDLIAVDPVFGRRGFARAMIEFASNHGIGDGSKRVNILVGTQAANTPSVNLYETVGFRLAASKFVLHHHGIGASYEQSKSVQ